MDLLFGIAVAVVVLAVAPAVLLFVGSRRFRKLVGQIVLIIAVVGVALYYYAASQDRRSHTLIPASQLALEDLKFDPHSPHYHLSGRLRNHSKAFTVTCITLEVIARDCPKGSTTPACTVIGDKKTNVYLNVAPGQSGHFDTYIYFPGGKLKPVGRLAWKYSIFETFAK